MFPVQVTHYADPFRPADILFHKKTTYFYPLFPVFDPIIFSCRFFFLILCFFEVINLNFSNINTMHLITTIQIHMFMAGAKWKKKSSFFALENKNPGTPPPIGPKPNTSNRGFAHAYLIDYLIFFFPSKFDR